MSTRIPTQSGQIRAGAYWPALAAQDLAWDRFGARDCGEVVTDHASSWVRRLATGAGVFYVKTYEYATWGSRLRGALRYTGPGRPSRAAREYDALCWYRDQLGHGAAPVAAFEHRRLGFVARAVLVTLEHPGERVDLLLRRADPALRRAVAAALGAFVAAAHARGARDGNLDLRNLLADRDDDGGWRFAKIDSPRFRRRPPGRAPDRRTRADWARLLPQLDAFGVADEARAAAPQPGGGRSSSSVTA